MNVVLVGFGIIVVAQFILCHFSLWWLLAFIARFIFCLRAVGVIVKVKYTYILEGVSVVIMLIWKALFHGRGWDVKEIVVTIIAAALSCLIVTIDSINYVYVVKDEEED